MAGTEGRVYGGDPNLIHVVDGKRDEMGEKVASFLDFSMRENAEGRTHKEQMDQNLCPGCYMVVMFDALIHLASANNQSPTELANSMIKAFEQYKNNPSTIEEIHVELDPC